ncbi:gliding motility lipoprotein GldD [Aquimarina litoralis]|uniref:gliding motility lipoprotein GldD n=1 Tax=Aquimarina litoralis TaxID=584605 RepID=UPI001C5A35E5|nr:gliding motility lipoprotein GldD [Aquimarina litoralis]MBW1295242.1 gliding motility lipoprotein GldD [Aquimarina litoralis]
MKKSRIYIFLTAITFSVLYSCGGDTLPKPKAMLRLSYPSPKYEQASLDCSYSFEKNSIASFQKARNQKECWYNIEYPQLKATIYLSYYNIDKNLDSLLRDAQNLTQEHFIKADAIQPKDFVYPEKKVYGRIYEVTGNAASSCQFYLTDSVRNFVSGSVYFKVKPNYDSILPAVKYLRNDVIHFMETVQWKE